MCMIYLLPPIYFTPVLLVPWSSPNARIVYIDGAFDHFHAGHVEILRLARKLGDFLLIGIHTDQTVRCIPYAYTLFNCFQVAKELYQLAGFISYLRT
ncbi:hypothetical protein K1719_024452 [Acacia pycnantha]|nr:hypothetical protein K1719_024452 [Acacia pycnantha]